MCERCIGSNSSKDNFIISVIREHLFFHCFLTFFGVFKSFSILFCLIKFFKVDGHGPIEQKGLCLNQVVMMLENVWKRKMTEGPVTHLRNGA
jgi:hypothetical protein